MLSRDVAMKCGYVGQRCGYVRLCHYFFPFKNVFLGFYQPSPMTDVKPIDFFILKSYLTGSFIKSLVKCQFSKLT